MGKGKKIGYVRVSTFDQNPERQLENIELDKTYTDKASGKDVNRPALQELVDYVRDGDTVVVHSMDRLARNLDDLRKLVYQLTGKQVKVQFMKENLIFSGDDSAMSTLLLSIMGAFAEFERSLIRERQLEGIALAKKRGAYKGRKKRLSLEEVEILKSRMVSGEKKSSVAKDFGISRETLYQYLKACHTEKYN
ncbi:MAG: recombinase family protein [Chlamydiia bacterium]|nr:recombinase family protein [Chlamydiia bacterium]